MTEAQMRDCLMDQLEGRVFHVTSHESYLAIARSGHIAHNADDRHGHVYGQSIGCIGRNLNAVCLFDLRDKDLTVLDYELCCYHLPIVPQFGSSVAFLFVAGFAHGRLRQWGDLTSEQKMSGQHIPKIECWYPGDLPIDNVSEVLIVDVDRPPPKGPADCLAEFMERTGWRPGEPMPGVHRDDS